MEARNAAAGRASERRKEGEGGAKHIQHNTTNNNNNNTQIHYAGPCLTGGPTETAHLAFPHLGSSAKLSAWRLHSAAVSGSEREASAAVKMAGKRRHFPRDPSRPAARFPHADVNKQHNLSLGTLRPNSTTLKLTPEPRTAAGQRLRRTPRQAATPPRTFSTFRGSWPRRRKTFRPPSPARFNMDGVARARNGAPVCVRVRGREIARAQRSGKINNRSDGVHRLFFALFASGVRRGFVGGGAPRTRATGRRSREVGVSGRRGAAEKLHRAARGRAPGTALHVPRRGRFSSERGRTCGTRNFAEDAARTCYRGNFGDGRARARRGLK